MATGVNYQSSVLLNPKSRGIWALSPLWLGHSWCGVPPFSGGGHIAGVGSGGTRVKAWKRPEYVWLPEPMTRAAGRCSLDPEKPVGSVLVAERGEPELGAAACLHLSSS